MKINNLIMGMIGIMVCVIMVGGALLPAVDSAIDNERTIFNNTVTNSNYSIIKTVESEENHVITWVPGSDAMIVDGNNVSVSSSASYMILSNMGSVDISTGGTQRYFTPEGGADFDSATTKINVTISGDVLTISSEGDTPVNLSLSGLEWYALPDEDGVYKLATSPQTDNGEVYYLNSIDQIYGVANIQTNSTGFLSFVGAVGTLGDGTTVNMVSDPVIDDRYENIVKVSKFNGYYLDPDYLTNSDGSLIVPYYVLIPTKVVGYTPENVINTALFNTVPLIAIAGLVMAGIYVFISRK